MDSLIWLMDYLIWLMDYLIWLIGPLIWLMDSLIWLMDTISYSSRIVIYVSTCTIPQNFPIRIGPFLSAVWDLGRAPWWNRHACIDVPMRWRNLFVEHVTRSVPAYRERPMLWVPLLVRYGYDRQGASTRISRASSIPQIWPAQSVSLTIRASFRSLPHASSAGSEVGAMEDGSNARHRSAFSYPHRRRALHQLRWGGSLCRLACAVVAPCPALIPAHLHSESLMRVRVWHHIAHSSHGRW